MPYKLTETENEGQGATERTKVYNFDTQDDAKNLLYSATSSWLTTAFRECMDVTIEIKEKSCETLITAMFDHSSYTVKRKITEEK